MVELRLLGPVQLDVAGGVVELGPARQRAVLVALAVDVGRPVPTETLIDRVWDEDPPDEARAGLYSYLTRLRRIFTQAAGGAVPVRIAHRPGGYLLEVDPDRVDAHRFGRLLDQAREEPDEARRAGLLRQALDLWAGPPLGGLHGRWIAEVREHLVQRRLSAVLALAPLELRAGHAATLADQLRPLIAEHPLVEPLSAQLIRALHACGRSGEALEAYGRIRRLLADELGADPGPELRELHQSILRGPAAPPPPERAPEAVRAESPPARPPRTAMPVGPAQLPPDVSGFTGRAEQLARLDALLAAAAVQATTVMISAIGGTAGIGKTTLAVHWAHRVADRFGDGQLYVNLRGFDPSGTPVAPAEAIRGFLDALQVPPERIPADLDAQAGLYRSLLAGRRMLIVLDNARDSEQVRPLLPGAPGCLVLVTSRNWLTGLVVAAGAQPVDLDVLSAEEARQLLAARLGVARVAAEPHAVEAIITACARLPLALTIVAARAATHPDFPLTALAAELRDARTRLDVLTDTDPAADVRAVFSWSYAALSPPAARLFRLLGLAPGPDISAAAAASLAGLPPVQGRRLLADLTRANLLTEHAPGRYGFHDLLRAYATEQAHTHDPDTDRRAAVHRLLDHYLHTAHAADRLMNPTRDPITLSPPQPGVSPERFGDYRQALAWFTAEHPVLLAAVDHAAAAGFDTHAWQLAWTLDTFLYWRGHWHDEATIQRVALAAAERLADPAAQARAHRLLGRAYLRQGRLDDAHTQLRHALDMFGQVGDLIGQARSHFDIENVLERQGRHQQALDHARQALDLFRRAGHQVGVASALNSVGWLHAQLGDHQQALTTCEQALTLHQQLGHRFGEGSTWDSLGYAHHHLGHHTQALTCYQHALDLYRDLGNRYSEAETLTHVGDAHHVAGNEQAAREAWQHALTILDDLHHSDADAVRAKLGHLPQRDRSRPDFSAGCWRREAANNH